MTITIILFTALVLIDQVVKFNCEKGNVNNEIIHNFLSLKLSYNKGMSWGQLSNLTPLLTVVSFLGIILLFYLCTKNNWKVNKVRATAITFALAGCVGNFIDRFFTTIGIRDGVIDMIDLVPFNKLCSLFKLKSAIFNIADAFLVIGLIVYAIDIIFFADWKKRRYENRYNR